METHNTNEKWAHVFSWRLSEAAPGKSGSLPNVIRRSPSCSWSHSCGPSTLFPQYVTAARRYDTQVLNEV